MVLRPSCVRFFGDDSASSWVPASALTPLSPTASHDAVYDAAAAEIVTEAMKGDDPSLVLVGTTGSDMNGALLHHVVRRAVATAMGDAGYSIAATCIHITEDGVAWDALAPPASEGGSVRFPAWKATSSGIAVLGATTLHVDGTTQSELFSALTASHSTRQSDAARVVRLVLNSPSDTPVAVRGSLTLVAVGGLENNIIGGSIYDAVTQSGVTHVVLPPPTTATVVSSPDVPSLDLTATNNNMSVCLTQRASMRMSTGEAPPISLAADNDKLRAALEAKEAEVVRLRAALRSMALAVEQCSLPAQDRAHVLEAASFVEETELMAVSNRVRCEVEQHELLNGMYRALDDAEEHLRATERDTAAFTRYPESYPRPSIGRLQWVELTLLQAQAGLKSTQFVSPDDVRASSEALNVISALVNDAKACRIAIESTVKAQTGPGQWSCPMCSKVFRELDRRGRQAHMNKHLDDDDTR
eukprot:PhM_4_TR13112/c0_g1_i1/m.11188